MKRRRSTRAAGIRHQASGIRHRASGIGHQASGIGDRGSWIGRPRVFGRSRLRGSPPAGVRESFIAEHETKKPISIAAAGPDREVEAWPLDEGQGRLYLGLNRRGVAQLGSALRSGRRGRRFKSYHPDSAGLMASASAGAISVYGAVQLRPVIIGTDGPGLNFPAE